MFEKNAIELVDQYITGWKQNDIKKICSCLLDDCTIIESHGPTYQGIRDIERWFQLWLAANSRIIKWDIIVCYYCHKKSVIFLEWDFACISNNKKYSLSGSSVIKFAKNKIAFIHEYRMTKPAYLWGKSKLESD